MSDQKRKIDYTVTCVSEFAERYNLSAKVAFQYLFKFKAIEFIKENYDIEHTLSFDDVIEDMFLICKSNGGSL